MTYETPEVLELGTAQEVIQGGSPPAVDITGPLMKSAQIDSDE